MSDPYRDWDAAYVLGALTPADEAAYEEHLLTCDECSAAVASLRQVASKLALVPDARALATLDPSPQPDLLPGLARAVRRDRRRNRFRMAGVIAGVAAGAAAIGAVVAVPLTREEPEGDYVVLTQTVASKLTADARLIEERWGTTIEISCRYDDLATPSERARGYELFVTDRAGKSTLIASWTASPGTTVKPSATTKLHRSEIAALDIRSSETGRILLAVHF